MAHRLLTVKIGEGLRGHVPLVVHHQDSLDVLGVRQPDVEAPVPEAFLRLTGIGGAVLFYGIDQGELPAEAVDAWMSSRWAASRRSSSRTAGSCSSSSRLW